MSLLNLSTQMQDISELIKVPSYEPLFFLQFLDKKVVDPVTHEMRLSNHIRYTGEVNDLILFLQISIIMWK